MPGNDNGLRWSVREEIPTEIVPVNERFKVKEGNIHRVSRFTRLESGIIRIEFCNMETLSPNEVAELLQKIVYFSARNYLDDYLRNELSKTQNGNWSHLRMIIVYKMLQVFNSEISDDHLFDKNNLNVLIEKLSFEEGAGQRNECRCLWFNLRLLGKYMWVTTLPKEYCHMVEICFVGKKPVVGEPVRIDYEFLKCVDRALEHDLRGVPYIMKRGEKVLGFGDE